MKFSLPGFCFADTSSPKSGRLPGEFNPVAGSGPARFTLFTFSNRALSGPGRAIGEVAELPPLSALKDESVTYWIRVVGLGDISLIHQLGQWYGLHHLALEDVATLGHRSKMEVSGDYLLFVLQSPPQETGRPAGQIGVFVRPGLLITFEAQETKLVEHLFGRLQRGLHTVDYWAGFLAYNLIDLIIDSFFPLLDKKAATLEELEELLTAGYPSQSELNLLHTQKRGLLTLKRILWPYVDLSQHLLNQVSLRHDEFRPFLGDLRDHILQAFDLITAYNEIADALSGICQSSLSTRTNEIVRVLTIISTIFMPLSFLAGLYGMNFDHEVSIFNMPELKFKYGYLTVLGLMAAVAGGMLWFFRRKKWF